MPRRKQPRCACGSNKPLPPDEDTCDICKRVCGCGKRIPYPGRGRPSVRCPECSELDRSGRVCPCGKPVPAGRRRYCSHKCLTAFWRTKRGAKSGERWHPEWGSVEDWEGDHDAAAERVAAWMRYAEKIVDARARGDSIVSPVHGDRMFVVRHTKLTFNKDGKGLPRMVPVDDVTRFGAMHPKPQYGHIIVNASMTAAVTLPTVELFSEMRKTRRWIPRYGDWEDVHCMPKKYARAFNLFLGV